LLERAESEDRILVTIDTDFGALIHLHDVPHAGLVRLPDVPAEQRIALVADLIDRYQQELEAHSIVTVRSGRIRISRSPTV
jgi:predicted nuclease of predicted toxin-antitoxin system